MKRFTVVLSVFLSISFTFQFFAQGVFSIHAGSALPMFDFATDDISDEDAGHAAIGLNFGLEYIYPLSDNGLGLFIGVDLHYNELQQGSMNMIKTMFEDWGLNVSHIDYYKYINIPFAGGFSYTYQANDKIGLLAKGGLAINFLKVTDMIVLASGGHSVVTLLDYTYGVGFRVGGGILINKYTSISFNYYGLGKLDLDGRVILNAHSEKIDGKQKVDLFTLTVGYSF